MNAAKAKGRAFENDCVDAFHQCGFPYAERRTQHAGNDQGDIAGVHDWVLECKWEKEMRLSDAQNELEVEMLNAGARYGAALHKRPRKPAFHAYAVMPFWLLARIARDLDPLATPNP